MGATPKTDGASSQWGEAGLCTRIIHMLQEGMLHGQTGETDTRILDRLKKKMKMSFQMSLVGQVHIVLVDGFNSGRPGISLSMVFASLAPTSVWLASILHMLMWFASVALTK